MDINTVDRIDNMIGLLILSYGYTLDETYEDPAGVETTIYKKNNERIAIQQWKEE